MNHKLKNKNLKKPLIVILGPTSSGKTRLAVELARKYNGEIVSTDSRQVYKGMDIGTGKDLQEYGTGKNKIPYHLIDIASPKTQFNIGRYQKLAYRAIDDILKRGKIPFLVGGSGLYIKSIVDGLVLPKAKANLKLRKKLNSLTLAELLKKLKTLDFATWKIIDKKNRRRVERAVEICLLTGQPLSQQRQANPTPYDILQIGLAVPREVLNKKIDKRLLERLKIPLASPFDKGGLRRILPTSGLIQEVTRLRQQGLSWKRLNDFGLEYRFISRYLRGELNYQEMFEQLSQAITNFAKRQMTWFKRDPRIHWTKNKKEALDLLGEFLLCHPCESRDPEE